MTPYYLILLIAVIVVIKAYKLSKRNKKMRTWKQVNRTIINYNGKTRQQIFEILELETKLLTQSYTIEEFSKPIFNKDGSTTYIIYVTPKITNNETTTL